MGTVEFIVTDERGLAEIEPLWTRLNEHHELNTRYFKGFYRCYSFGDRIRALEKKAREGELRLEIARETEACRAVAYCVASLSAERVGEIDSVFVDEEHRLQGIGSGLVKRCIAWMEEGGAKRKTVIVADGNDEAWRFYQRFGFYPRALVLWQRGERPDAAPRCNGGDSSH